MATSSAGAATIIKIDVVRIDHVKTGRGQIVIPGARRRSTVPRTQIASSSADAAASITPMIHRYIPSPGVLVESDSGSNAFQPASPGPFWVDQPSHMVTPPA